jgi:arginase family enzyme
MNSQKYVPLDSKVFPRYEGIRTFMRLPHVQETEGVDFAIIGVPIDGASTYESG